MYTELRDALIERFADKEAVIRAHAVIALSKLVGSEDPEAGERSMLQTLLESLETDPAPYVHPFFPVESLTTTQNLQRSPPSRTPAYPSPSWYNRHPPEANERRRSRNAQARVYIFARRETEAPKTADDRAERGDREGWIGRSGGGGESSCGEGSQCMV